MHKTNCGVLLFIMRGEHVKHDINHSNSPGTKVHPNRALVTTINQPITSKKKHQESDKRCHPEASVDPPGIFTCNPANPSRLTTDHGWRRATLVIDSRRISMRGETAYINDARC